MKLATANQLYAGTPTGWVNLGEVRNVEITFHTPRGMSIAAWQSIMAGGPGSGCNPAVGKCGRPKGQWRKFNENRVGGYFRKGTVIARMYEELAGKAGQWHAVQDFAEKFKSQNIVIETRIRELAYTGKRSGLWTIERKGDQVRMLSREPGAVAQPGTGQIVQQGTGTSKAEQELLSRKIDFVQPLDGKYGGGGDNWSVIFADGSKGLFKPDDGERPGLRSGKMSPGYQGAREAATYKVAELVGMEDMVPVTVQTKVNIRGQEKEGALRVWATGKRADRLPWEDGSKYDGGKALAKAAVFDFVVGNMDRHQGNWLVSGKNLVLIDHGINFPDKNDGRYDFNFNRELIEAAEEGKATGAPKDYAAPYVRNREAILAAVKATGLPRGSVEGVDRRIRNLSRRTRWNQLREGMGDD